MVGWTWSMLCFRNLSWKLHDEWAEKRPQKEKERNTCAAAASEQCIVLGNYDRETTRNLGTGFKDMFLAFGRALQLEQVQTSSESHDTIK
ncbi:Cilia- And Flagella-Associated Protein 44 [Manis pentadactyla]|nr:Cilia- And Flagella-Associated Protein 44 [Manis pentadactyla]